MTDVQVLSRYSWAHSTVFSMRSTSAFVTPSLSVGMRSRLLFCAYFGCCAKSLPARIIQPLVVMQIESHTFFIGVSFGPNRGSAWTFAAQQYIRFVSSATSSHSFCIHCATNQPS